METSPAAPESNPTQSSGDLPRRSRPAPRGTASYQRKRAVKACQVCRARRTKCDNLKPSCSFCLKVGAKCIQSAEDLSSFDPASLKILERLECLEQLVRSSRCVSAPGPSPAPQSGLEQVSEEQEDERDEVHEQGPPTKKQKTHPARIREHGDDSSAHLDISMVLLPSSEDMLSSWPVLQALATSYYHGSPALSHHQHPHQAQQSYHTPQSHHSQPHGHAHSITSPMPSLAQVLPDDPRHVAALLDKFFSHVHVKNPILNESLTRQMVLSKAIDGQLGFDWSAESCLALLICALGALSTRFGPSTDSMPGTRSYMQAHVYFSAAQKRLGLLLACDDEDGIVAPQCFFLAGVFMMCTFQSGKGWKYFVQAVVGCQEFGFLTAREDGEGSGGGDSGGVAGRQGKHDTPYHQAIYWSAWKSERELRGDVRRPDFLVSGADHHDTRLYPSFFPTPPAPRVRRGADVGELGVGGEVDGDGQEAEMMSLDQSREQMSWYFYLAEISLRRLIVRVTAEMVAMMETANETSPSTSLARQTFLHAMADALPSYEVQVSGWQTSLPPCLSFDNNDLPSDQQQHDDDDVCRFVLRGHLINFYEIIYWPFLSMFLGQGCGSGDLGELSTLRSRFAGQAQRGLEFHVLRLRVNKVGYRHRHHGTYPMLRSCSRSSLALVAASRLQHASLTDQDRDGYILVLPEGWQAEVLALLETLDFWSAETNQHDEIRKVLQQGVFS